MQTMPQFSGPAEPPFECDLCPRLAAFRADNRKANPDWFNGPVPGFGPNDARLLIAGLAPGLQGANRTGRPFTGDWAGDLLYPTLLKFGFATGEYRADPKDGLQMVDAKISNVVRCVPPKNKPVGAEINTCRTFLKGELGIMGNLKVIIALGKIAHDSVVRAFGLRLADLKFAHGAKHDLSDDIMLVDSYHCSRYNTNTGRLTEAMFHDVFKAAKQQIERT